MDGLDDGSQAIHNPATSLAGNSSSLVHPQMSAHSEQMGSHLDYAGDELGQGNDDDYKAASGLLGMSLHGRGNSRAVAHPTNQFGYYGNGGAYNNAHMQDSITSPITSSGRQSANSYHSQTPTAYMSNHIQDEISQQQLMQQFNWTHSGQQQMPQSMPRARPASLQLDMNHFNYIPTNPQMHMSPSTNSYSHARSRPAAPIRFGSDDSFGRSGYRGPHNSVSLEEEKQGNLINVPLAAQAAANGHAHAQPHVPFMTQHLPYSQLPIASSSHHLQNMSAGSSPGAHMGGLPLHSPSINASMYAHPYHPVAPQHIEDDEYNDSDEEPAFPEQQVRKRRKSQMERNNDADYYPSSHTKTTVFKRESKPSKNIAMEESDDDNRTPAKAAPGKRRKSSMAGVRPHLGSSNSNSPSANPSPVAKQAAGSSKKKGRDSEPRKNLSEDQKRMNHIASEKQRRDLIKVQYDALDVLVPALKGGKSGLSRSDVLQEIVSYVESIMNGNAEMDRLLKEVGDMEVADAPHVDGDEAA